MIEYILTLTVINTIFLAVIATMVSKEEKEKK